MGLLDDIENLAKSNASETDSAVSEAENFAEQETGGQFNSEIQAGGQQVEDYLGTQQNGQGN